MSLPTSARAQSLLTISLSSIRRRKHDYEDADIGPKHKTGKKSDPGSQMVVDTTYNHLPKSKRVSEPGMLEISI